MPGCGGGGGGCWIQGHLKKKKRKKKESFKPYLKSGEGDFSPNPNRKLVPQKRNMKAEGSASHSIFKYYRNHKQAHSLLGFYR